MLSRYSIYFALIVEFCVRFLTLIVMISICVSLLNRSVSIEKCRCCTIVLGPVELSVDLVRSEQTTVVAVCRRFTTT